MVPLNNLDQYSVNPSPDNDVIELYAPAIEKIKPSIYETVFNFDWFSRNVNGIKEFNIHPIPSEHLEYVEKVLPEVVATREDGIKAVKYDRLIPLLIEAIKELKAEVDALKGR
jgi:hypothetical protein